ncbi:DUF2946 domain-containing protein [Massilia sp. METH4]|uniref:DUF2946 domain-containing protein n=1 Tax=Massilia sp. METH4 TaxID=3123041 RepID=UPI0030CF7771
MRMRRQSFIAACWVTLAAMLLAVVAPALAHAFAPHARAVTITAEICSATGMAGMQQIVAEEKSPASSHQAHFEHCPFCQTGSSPLALPSATYVLPLLAGTPPRPALFYRSPTPLFAWTAAKPRGPPLA